MRILLLLIEHMKQNPKCGAAGCKILIPMAALLNLNVRSHYLGSKTKLLGLHSIFPKSRLFGQYYLTCFRKPTGEDQCFIWLVYVLENRAVATIGGLR